MKKVISIILSVLILTVLLVSCSSATYTPLDGKNIVESAIHKEFSMMSSYVDTSTFEAVNELSTQVVKCKVTGINYLEATVMNTISFKYDVVIEEIYLDIGDRLDIGDSVIVSSNNGIIKASEAAELFKNKASAAKYGILQDGPYGENDYVVYSMFDGIPIEIGNSYIIYLTDDYLENENVYADLGYEYSYAILDNGDVYTGADIVKLSMNEKKLVEFVKKGISERSGRLEEVGRKQLVSELAEKQRKERAEKEAETD